MAENKETPPTIWAVLTCLINLAALLIQLYNQHWFF